MNVNLKYLMVPLVMICSTSAGLGATNGVINIQGTEYNVDTVQCSKVGPGTIYTKLRIGDKSSPLDIFMLEVDLTNPYIQMQAVVGHDSIETTERPTEMAKRRSNTERLFFAGTNGDGFGSVAGEIQGCPYNSVVDCGKLLCPPTDRGTIGFSPDNIPHIGYIEFSGSVTANGITCNIDDVNRYKRKDNLLVFYNDLNGNYTHTDENGTEVLVELLQGEEWLVNKPVKFKVVDIVSGKGNMHIDKNKGVLSGNGDAETYLKSLKINDTGELTLNLKYSDGTYTPLNTLTGGDRIILLDDVIQDNDWAERHPRTAVGYSEDKKTLYFCLVDGRSASSVGVSTKQLVDIIKSAGAHSAINLDGGGSSTMYICGLNQVNKPSDGIERPVGNGLFITTNAPQEQEIAEIRPIIRHLKLPEYGIYEPVFYGYNKYGILVNTNIKDVILSYPEDAGIIDGDKLVPIKAGTYVLTATYKEVKTSLPVTVSETDNINMRLNKIITDTYREYPVEVQTTVKDQIIPLSATALSWTSDDTSIAIIDPESGILKGISDGETVVHGRINEFEGILNVSVEKPTVHAMAIDPDLKPDTWKITQTGGTNLAATPYENGMRLTYTGASGRGPNIKLTKSLQIWSLPDSIRLRINPGEAPIKKVTVSLRANESGVQNIIFPTPEANKMNIISVTVSDWCNTDDMQNYPIYINSIIFEMGTSATGKEYTIDLPGIESIYDAIPAGIEEIVMTDNTLCIYPNPVKQGEQIYINIPDEVSATVTIYNITGQVIRTENVANGGNIFSIETSGIESGIYFIIINQNNTIKSGKVLIK